MAAFDAMIEAGRAVLEGREKPAVKGLPQWRGHGKIDSVTRTRALEKLKEAARTNPRLHVAIKVGAELIPIACEGNAAMPQKDDAPMMQSGVCKACGLVGVAVVNGETQTHKDRNGKACDGKAATAKAPIAFMPKCGKGKPGITCDCRACKVAASFVRAFDTLRDGSTIDAGESVITSTLERDTKPTIKITMVEPDGKRTPIAPTATKRRAISPANLMSGRELLDACVAIGAGMVSAFEALRELGHTRELGAMAANLSTAIGTIGAQQGRIADLEATIKAGQVQLDAARAGHRSQVAELHKAPTAPHTCSRCGNDASARAAIFGGRVICGDCRPAEREAYYAARGRSVPPRRERGRMSRVASMTVHADAVTVASAS